MLGTCSVFWLEARPQSSSFVRAAPPADRTGPSLLIITLRLSQPIKKRPTHSGMQYSHPENPHQSVPQRSGSPPGLRAGAKAHFPFSIRESPTEFHFRGQCPAKATACGVWYDPGPKTNSSADSRSRTVDDREQTTPGQNGREN